MAARQSCMGRVAWERAIAVTCLAPHEACTTALRSIPVKEGSLHLFMERANV